MLSYMDFKRTIDALCDNYDKLDKIAETLGWIEAFDLSMSGETTKLLTHIFKDKGGWIDYWVYERNFGRDWYNGCAHEADGANIDLSTTKQLYDFLVKNMESNRGGD
jgi:hypothetical protein